MKLRQERGRGLDRCDVPVYLVSLIVSLSRVWRRVVTSIRMWPIPLNSGNAIPFFYPFVFVSVSSYFMWLTSWRIGQALGVGIANNDDLSRMEHPPLLSPSIPPPPVMDLGGLGGPPPPPPPPGLPFDPLFNAGHFIPTPPFMSLDSGMLPPLPSIPPPPSGLLTERFRLPPLGGLMAPGSFDADYRRDLSDPPPPRRGYSPTRRLASSPLGSERSVRSDRSDRMVMDHYEFR